MHIEVVYDERANTEYLQIDDARITHLNFSGVAKKYNREGERNFSVVIPDQESADRLLAMGYNVKTRPPREEGEDPFRFLPVKVGFNGRGPGPFAYLRSGEKQVSLTEETIGCLDDVNIASVELDIRPRDWEVNGKTGRTAYLHAIRVTQVLDRFAEWGN